MPVLYDSVARKVLYDPDQKKVLFDQVLTLVCDKTSSSCTVGTWTISASVSGTDPFGCFHPGVGHDGGQISGTVSYTGPSNEARCYAIARVNCDDVCTPPFEDTHPAFQIEIVENTPGNFGIIIGVQSGNPGDPGSIFNLSEGSFSEIDMVVPAVHYDGSFSVDRIPVFEPYDGTFSTSECSADRDSDTCTKFKPKFKIPVALGHNLVICYNEHFVPHDPGPPVDTEKTTTIPSGETEVIGDEVGPPSTQGVLTITDIQICE